MNKYKNDFPILKNNNIAYLDSGATSQKPLQVINAVDNFYRNYNANPHRGAYSLSIEATNLYEDTRAKIAKFVNARYKEEIIFSKNATESLNLLAYSYGIDKLKEDDEIVNVPLSLDRMSRCKLVLDDDRIVELNVEDYLNHENIVTETDMSGYSTITLKNIKDIKIK